MTIGRWLLGSAVLTMGFAAPAGAVELAPLLETLQSVGPKGAGNAEASRAWQQVVGVDAQRLPELLAAMDDAGPIADNWIRAAVDTVAENQLRQGRRLPADALEQFAKDEKHDPRARRLAFEWLVEVDPTTPRRLLPDMLDDVSLELRRDAVDLLVGDAVQAVEVAGEKEAAPLLRRALAAARDRDQITQISGRLRAAGETVDLARHYGYVLRWKLIGPFDNRGGVGFDAVYPPEEAFDAGAAYEGKSGPVRWIDHASTHAQGNVDLNQALVEEKGVVAYAAAEFFADKRRDVEIRLTSAAAVKFWVNGTLLAAHNVYHSGSPFDQYTGRATLEPGRNVILAKICQNEQTQSWARVWSFRLRVCDALGTAVLSADRGELEGEKGEGVIR